MSNKPKTIYFGESNHSGVQIEYVKSRKTVSISGWYDGCVGIQGGSMSIKEFCEKLNIEAKDLR